MSIAGPYSGRSVPSMIPGCSRNWRRTSSTTSPPTRPTACIASEANRNGIRPPIKRPAITQASLQPEERRQALLGEPVRVRAEEDERGERGGADRVALRHGLRRVADRVERVGDRAHLGRQIGHLGDAAGVVGDRAVRVERDDEAGHRELRHDGDADPEETGEVVGDAGSRSRSRSTGSAVACIPTARPSMMFVAWPVCDARAIALTGFQRVPV